MTLLRDYLSGGTSAIKSEEETTDGVSFVNNIKCSESKLVCVNFKMKIGF